MAVQDRLKLKRPLDAWSVREQLCLASSVVKSGDQNWMGVSRSLKQFIDKDNLKPVDWYSPKCCAQQYSQLLEGADTPKRKKRDSGETSNESIVRRLTQERISELNLLLNAHREEYLRLKQELQQLRSGAIKDDKLQRMWQQIEHDEREQEQRSKVHAAWLAKRQQKKEQMAQMASLSVPRKEEQMPLDPGDAGAEDEEKKNKGGGRSPLLTSLLKSPSPTTQMQSAQVTSPTIASLLGSSPKVPSQMGQTVAPQLHQMVASGVASSSERPSAGAPTLSMLLEIPTNLQRANLAQMHGSQAAFGQGTGVGAEGMGQGLDMAIPPMANIPVTESMVQIISQIDNIIPKDIIRNVMDKDEMNEFIGDIEELIKEEITASPQTLDTGGRGMEGLGVRGGEMMIPEGMMKESVPVEAAVAEVGMDEIEASASNIVDIIGTMAEAMEQKIAVEGEGVKEAEVEEIGRVEKADVVVEDEEDKTVGEVKEDQKVEEVAVKEVEEVAESKEEVAEVTGEEKTEEAKVEEKKVEEAVEVVGGEMETEVKLDAEEEEKTPPPPSPPPPPPPQTVEKDEEATPPPSKVEVEEEKESKEEKESSPVVVEEEEKAEEKVQEPEEKPEEEKTVEEESPPEEPKEPEVIPEEPKEKTPEKVAAEDLKAEEESPKSEPEVLEVPPPVKEVEDEEVDSKPEVEIISEEPKEPQPPEEPTEAKTTEKELEVVESIEKASTPPIKEVKKEEVESATAEDDEKKVSKEAAAPPKETPKEEVKEPVKEPPKETKKEEEPIAKQEVEEKPESEEEEEELKPASEVPKKENVESGEDVTELYDEEPSVSKINVGRAVKTYSKKQAVVDSETESESSESADYRSWKKSIMVVYNRLATHKFASVFLKPITEEYAPGYHSVIYRPMDLSTIKKNIDNGTIRSTNQFKRDVMLMFQNAIMYNRHKTIVHQMAVTMQEECLEQMQILAQVRVESSYKRETRTATSSSNDSMDSVMKRKRSLITMSPIETESPRTKKYKKNDND